MLLDTIFLLHEVNTEILFFSFESPTTIREEDFPHNKFKIIDDLKIYLIYTRSIS